MWPHYIWNKHGTYNSLLQQDNIMMCGVNWSFLVKNFSFLFNCLLLIVSTTACLLAYTYNQLHNAEYTRQTCIWQPSRSSLPPFHAYTCTSHTSHTTITMLSWKQPSHCWPLVFNRPNTNITLVFWRSAWSAIYISYNKVHKHIVLYCCTSYCSYRNCSAL